MNYRTSYIIVLFCICLSLTSCIKGDKTAFVETSVLFDGFNASIDFRKKINQEMTKKQSVLDSLMIDVNLAKSQLNEKPNNKELREKYLMKSNFLSQLNKEFEEDMVFQETKYSNQILEHINQYVLQYGKENEYDYIYGANGNGTMMYGNDSKNITKDVLNYINDKYEGF